MDQLKHLVLLYFFIATSFSMAEDYYKLLGVERNANQRDIRKAFKRIAITEHPDKNSDDPQAHEKFVKLTTAYEVLKDPDLRKKYDLHGEEGLDRSKRYSNYHSYTYYTNNFGIYDDDPEILTLNDNDFFENVLDSEKMWLINFYSPQCSHCHHLAPIWRKVAKELEGVIRIGAVNCEDDWSLCNQVGVRSYPTLLHYSKKTKQGIEYKGPRTYEAIVRFVLDQLDADIHEINKSTWTGLLDKRAELPRPMLVFVCGENRNCFNSDERLKVAAIFDKIVDVKVFNCQKNDECGSMFTNTTGLVLLSPKPTVLESIYEVDDLVERILDELPEPKDIDDETFEKILKDVKKKSSDGWLICFYINHATEFDVMLKQLPGVLQDVNLAKIDCNRYEDICKSFKINNYPAWIVFKPGGAYELKHGKNSLNDVANFAKSSLKAQNVWSLSEDKIETILQRRSKDAWFLDWYSPLCPPCLKFLPEVRKASLEFKESDVRFGIIDCTAHPAACTKYNIRVYPTAMLVNGSSLTQFKMHKTASNVIEFIKEAKNPTVFHLNSKTFYQLSKKKSKELWVVDYFASWCGPCQMLAPQWTLVAKALKLLPFVKVASLDCEAEGDLCRSQAVRSYPTIRLYPIGSDGLNSVAMYSGERDHNSILRWITSFLPLQVLELNRQTLESEVIRTNKIVLVDFYAPWCGHCIELEPHFSIAAQLMKGKVTFVRLNCDRFRNECNQADVRAYPSLKLYYEKKSLRSLNSSKRVKGATAEAIVKDLEVILKNIKNKKYHDEL